MCDMRIYEGGFEMMKAIRENWEAVIETTVLLAATMLVLVGFASMVTPF